MVIFIALLASYIFPLLLYFFLKANHKEDMSYKKDCRSLLFSGILLAFPVFLFSLLCNILFRLTGLYGIHPYAKSFLTAFFLNALSEELMKYLAARRIINKNRNTLSFLDTMAYTSIPAIGFELMESVVYLIESNVPQILVRGITNMHAVFGLITGFILAKGHKKGRKNPALPAVLTAILIHGVYNFFLTEGLVETGWGFISLLIAFICLILSIGSFFFVRKARKNSYYTEPLFSGSAPEENLSPTNDPLSAGED